MNRAQSADSIFSDTVQWDIVVIGGGATGIGIAVDAASRGYSVCLLEQSDFGKGTSSRSTKLVHGGVRYLRQGNISLVMEALKERGILRQNAPHLVHELPFIVPNYARWEAPFYGFGMKVYDLLAFGSGFGHSRLLTKAEVLEHIPTLDPEKLRGGVIYYDGQFDDARLLIHLAQTADQLGAKLLNYARVVNLTKAADGKIDGVCVDDLQSGQRHTIRARCVINATGAFTDAIRKIDDPATTPMISPSQGVHLVLNRSFLPGDAAIMVPRTDDGRVMFAIPWYGRVLIGTTDTPITNSTLEPMAMESEIEFLLNTASQYLAKHPTRDDVLSVFAGIRPLVKSSADVKSSSLSRDHTIISSESGLITIAGGKWTTYRKMAEDCVDHAAMSCDLEKRPCVTKDLRIHGYDEDAQRFGDFSHYGSDALKLQELTTANPSLDRRLHPDLPVYASMVTWAVRFEMARTVDDVLARRTRALLLNAKAAIAIAPEVGHLMAAELGRDENWEKSQVADFTNIAQSYVINSSK